MPVLIKCVYIENNDVYGVYIKDRKILIINTYNAFEPKVIYLI